MSCVVSMLVSSGSALFVPLAALLGVRVGDARGLAQMRSVGEVMSIARDFTEGIQKAMRMVNGAWTVRGTLVSAELLLLARARCDDLMLR